MANAYKSLEELWKTQRTEYAAYKDGLYYPVEDISGIDRALQRTITWSPRSKGVTAIVRGAKP